jgi:nucleoside phosphorylase
MDDEHPESLPSFASLREEEIAREACLGIMFHLKATGQHTAGNSASDHKRVLLLADYARRSVELPIDLQQPLDRAIIESFNAARPATSPADLPRPTLTDVDVAIVTVLPEELHAVLDVFGIEQAPQGAQPFYQCQLSCRGRPGRPLDLVITSVLKPLNVHVGAPIARLRHKYSPRAAFLVGVAGGRVGKSSPGDVIIGQRVFYYEPGRVTSDDTAPRPQTAEPSNRYGNGLLSYDPEQTSFHDRIRAFTGKLSPQDLPRTLRKNHMPTVRQATIASGENVLRDGRVLSDLAQRFDDSIAAVDQESYGFADSVRDLPWAIFRGISDNADENQDDRWKYVAAGFAAVCLQDFLETFYVPPDSPEL